MTGGLVSEVLVHTEGMLVVIRPTCVRQFNKDDIAPTVTLLE